MTDEEAPNDPELLKVWRKIMDLEKMISVHIQVDNERHKWLIRIFWFILVALVGLYMKGILY